MNSTYFLNAIMGNVFRTKTDVALPMRYYLGLSRTAPMVDGTNVSEPSEDAGYSRVVLWEHLSSPVAEWSGADKIKDDGVIINIHALSFPKSTANWGDISHFVVYDSLTEGNLLMYDQLDEVRRCEKNTTVTFAAGDLKFVLQSPIAIFMTDEGKIITDDDGNPVIIR